MHLQLKDKVAIVTGAGSGMGRAITRLFAAQGARVLAADVKPDGVNALIEGLPADTAGEVSLSVTDVSDREQVESMIDLAVERYGKLDILVNNAGIMDGMTPVAELSDELWFKVLGVNLNSVMFACRKAVNVMCNQNGSIINIASVGGLHGSRAGAAYTASKHGVVGLTKNIGYMYAGEGIRCNAIAPGGIDTNIGVGLSGASEFGFERMKLGLGSSPRTGQPEEVAAAALFLASDAASFVNGTVLTVDGGWTAF